LAHAEDSSHLCLHEGPLLINNPEPDILDVDPDDESSDIDSDTDSPALSTGYELFDMVSLDVDLDDLFFLAPDASVDYDNYELFVIRLYEKVLGRSCGTSELEYWANLLRSGGGTASSVASSFFFSNEMMQHDLPNNDYVEVLYLALLGRASGAGEKTYWVNMLNAGLPREDAFSSFLYSTEFDDLCRQSGIQRGSYAPPPGGMARVFTIRMYRVFLLREPDSGGLDYWHNSLRNGS